MADDVPEDVSYVEFTFNGVVHRMPITPEHARRWLEDEEALGLGRGKPCVDEHDRLIEHHGLPQDPNAEPVEPVVLGVPIDPEELEALEPDDENPYDDEP